MKLQGQKLESVAGAYVLGTLPVRARRRFEKLLREDVNVRRSYTTWRNHRHVHRQLRRADVLAGHAELVVDAVPVATQAAATNPREPAALFNLRDVTHDRPRSLELNHELRRHG